MSSPASARSDDFIGLPFELDETARHVMAAALLYIDIDLRDAEKDEERKTRKTTVVKRKQLAFKNEHADADFPISSGAKLVEYIGKASVDWPEEKRTLVLVETCFTPPFYPYELKFSKKDHLRSLTGLAAVLGLGTDSPQKVLDSIQSAQRAHLHVDFIKLAGIVAGGGLVGYFAAPVLAAWIGSAAGLSGAAAVSHGLAILGGGSLAAGGGGMFGGVVFVTGAGAVGAGGGMFLVELGHARAVAELVRLQVTFRHVIIASQLRQAKMISVIEKLRRQQDELRKNLEAERGMNEKNADRLKEIERVIRAYDDSITWIEQQEKDAA